MQMARVRFPDDAKFLPMLCNFHGKKTPPAGLEPAIFGLEVRRVIHYATRASFGIHETTLRATVFPPQSLVKRRSKGLFRELNPGPLPP